MYLFKWEIFILLCFSTFVFPRGVEGSIRNARSPLTSSPPRSDDGELLARGLLDSSEEMEEDINSGRSISSNTTNSKNTNSTSSSGSFYLPEGYNKFEIPLGEQGAAVYVHVSIFIRTILDFNVQTEELLLDTDLGLKWVDWKIYNHLKKNDFKDPVTGKVQKNMTLDSEILKEIWKPDVYIDEMAGVEKTSLLSKLITLKFLGDAGIQDSGDIVYSSRNSLRLRCDMHFKYYPADTQTCVYHLRSYSYNEPQLRLYWLKPTGIFLDDPSDPNFDLQVSSSEPKTMYKKFYIVEKFNQYRDGNYSALQFTIKARRKLSYHVVQTYLPSVLLIMITWLCFLLPANMVEARIGISMTTVLTLTAMFASVREQSPAVSYTMAIDIWMVFCIFFVFIALLLFTVIYWMKSRLIRHNEMLELQRNLIKASEEGESSTTTTEGIRGDTALELPSITDKEKYNKIVTITKKYAFWTFAIIFGTFFVSYWIWLLICSGHLDWHPNPDYNSHSDFEVNEDEADADSNLYLYRGVRKGVNDTDEEDAGAALLQTLDEIDAAFERFLNEISNNNDTKEADDDLGIEQEIATTTSSNLTDLSEDNPMGLLEGGNLTGIPTGFMMR